MLRHHEHFRLEVMIPYLLVDEGRSLAEGTEFLVESRGLVFVLCVLNLMRQTQIEDQGGEWSVLDIVHRLSLEVEHHSLLVHTQVVRELELELILPLRILHAIK